MRNLHKKLIAYSHNKNVKNIITLMSGTVSGQTMVLLSSPLVTRIYSPEDFGVFAVYIGVISILSSASSLKYEMAIPLVESQVHAITLTKLSFFIILVTGGGIFLLTNRQEIFQLLNLTELLILRWWIPLGVILLGLLQALTYLHIRQKSFSQIALTKIFLGIGMSILPLILGFPAFKSNNGLITGYLVGIVIGIIILLKNFYKDIFLRKDIHFCHDIVVLVKQYRHFPIFSSWAGMMNSASLMLPSILFAYSYGVEVAGLYALADRVVKAPVSLLGQSIAQVYFSQASDFKRGAPQKLTPFFIKISQRLLLIGLTIVVPLILIAPSLFTFLFGTHWYRAGCYVSIMGVMMIMQIIANPLSQTLNILEHQHILALWDLGRLIAVLSAILLPKYLGFNTEFVALASYSIIMAISYAILWLMSWKYTCDFVQPFQKESTTL